MSSKVNLEKTPRQVFDEVESGLEKLSQELQASQGHRDKGKSAMLTVVSVLVVFVINSLLTFYADNKGKEGVTENLLNSNILNPLRIMISRIDKSVGEIQLIKGRAAPNLPIDQQLEIIRSTAQEMREITGAKN